MATTGLVLLYLVALGCEGYGLWTIALDVRKTTEVFRTKSATAQFVGVGGIESSAEVGRPTVTGGEPPTLEQRIAALETQVPQIQRSIEETARSMRADLRSEMRHSDEVVRRQFQGELAALAKTVEGALYVPEPWVRWRGPLALGAGILLGAAGNIWSALMPS